ncbi:ktr system potassium uptake protein B [Thalassobacillus devorans]|uniref:Ktr system potassium uptake protein B n=1 Tax=Thalassobacillus devorans TaxID=279813 RepID=A0ABQ1PDZ5_9BACI|nr:TrkH family potassium uptake protein [Thalassobacillus devorans]NIK29277.1 trk system potassium uptake protein TrkH [Thalassobacillus devorans]GGC95428.1 ktr system potassium uptake protein B [Thalassobacillus devorans]
MKSKLARLNPPQILLLVFVSLILTGAGLLKLPVATTNGITFLDALFTATSAMTVTGLIVVDTGSAFSTFGEVIIMLLIQLGGLGIMTFAVLIFIMMGKKIGLKERLLVKQALNQNAIGDVVLLVKRLLIFSLSVEAIAVILLSFVWGPEMGWKDGIYASVFHAISAFNNAGFSIWENSLSDYVIHPMVNVTISVLFIIGGIGFTVVFDSWHSREFLHLRLHTKIMLIGTIVINIFSVIVLMILEFNNPATIGDLSNFGKVQASYFQAVTPRTAGFNTLDIAQMEHASLFYIITLMFVGGGSTSTAGGIKLTTALIIILATIAFLKNREHVVVFRRRIGFHLVMRALALTIMSLSVVITTVFLLNLTEKEAPFLNILFESVSAFGTVGLSMGLTGELSVLGKIIIIITMLVGKLGPLTFAFAFAHPSTDIIKYPKEEVLTG